MFAIEPSSFHAILVHWGDSLQLTVVTWSCDVWSDLLLHATSQKGLVLHSARRTISSWTGSQSL